MALVLESVDHLRDMNELTILGSEPVVIKNLHVLRQLKEQGFATGDQIQPDQFRFRDRYYPVRLAMIVPIIRYFQSIPYPD